jgi:transaldolase
MERLIRLYDEFGQSPWLDNLKRSYLTAGTLAELRDGGIRGLTSNPTIFQKAIQGSPDYDAQFGDLAKLGNPVISDYWALVLQDINGALDTLATGSSASRWTPGWPTTGRARSPAPARCTRTSTART